MHIAIKKIKKIIPYEIKKKYLKFLIYVFTYLF